MNRSHCTKRAFFNKAEAKMMLQSTLGSPSAARKECRFYRCDSCNLYHLTSLPLEEYLVMKEFDALNDGTNLNAF